MMEFIGWVFTALIVVPLAFVLLNCAADAFVKWWAR